MAFYLRQLQGQSQHFNAHQGFKMPKEYISINIPDISGFAKLLKKEIDTKNGNLSHVEILNIIARICGNKNFQQLRASTIPNSEVPNMVLEDEEKANANLKKLKRYLNENFQVKTLPSKLSQQELIIYYIWAFIEKNKIFNEIELNKYLNKFHTFGDCALLRRYMFEYGLLSRSKDCSDYKKLFPKIPKSMFKIVDFANEISKQNKL